MIAMVHGALTSFALALIVVVAQSWPIEPDAAERRIDQVANFDSEYFSCGFDGVQFELSMCPHEDYRPAPPRDGSWCGVRLDDRDPIRPDSFPTLRVRIPFVH